MNPRRPRMWADVKSTYKQTQNLIEINPNNVKQTQNILKLKLK
jgi:hypothetical protein